MDASALIDELRPLGTDGYKKTIMKHGAKEPCFGVKIEELKKFQKRIKTDYRLALDLYATGVYDAMYLAGLIADDMKMTKADLDRWAKGATSTGIAEYTVPWVASQGRYGAEMARKWIESKTEEIASAGWNTFSCLLALKPDADLDVDEHRALLRKVAATIHDQPNRVRYVMNGFVIAVGSYLASLTGEALEAAKTVGMVKVNMGDTACKVPDAKSYIEKTTAGGIAKKRKTVKC